MSTIIKEPFAPRRRHLMIDHARELSLFCRRVYQSLVRARKLAEASLDDLCMVVLLVCLFLTTLLLPVDRPVNVPLDYKVFRS